MVDKILVTGATGFIGSHLIPHLRYYDVYALERYMTGRYILGNNRVVKTVFADLNDHTAIREIVATVQPEYVIHLAAISPVSYSYTHPFEVLETNFIASVNLAETNRLYNPKLKQFIAAGTSEEYGIQYKFPIPETADLRPNSPYAVSKVAMDRYLQYMRDAYDFPMTLIRPFNTYGRVKNTHFVVERIISQMLKGDEISLGDPEPIRDLMYISDHVDAYLTCLDNVKALRRTFNFCTGNGISIKELVDKIMELIGFKGVIHWNTIPPRPLDIHTLVGDNFKALNQLGWSPQVSLEQGLEMTIKRLKKRV